MVGTQNISRRFTLEKKLKKTSSRSRNLISVFQVALSPFQNTTKQLFDFFFIEEVPDYFWPIWANPRRQQRSRKKNCRENNFFRPGSQQRQLWPHGRCSVFLVRRWQVFPSKKRLVKFPRLNSQHPSERKFVERCETYKSLIQFIFNSQELKARFYSSKVKSFRRAFIFSVQNVFLGLSEIFIGDFHSSFTQCHQTCLSTDSL